MDLDRMAGCTTDYINFCIDVFPVRTVRCFPSNKLWITSNIKCLQNEKKEAFKVEDWEKIKRTQHDLKKVLKQAKGDYKRKLQRKLQHNSIQEVWKGMKTTTTSVRLWWNTSLVCDD